MNAFLSKRAPGKNLFTSPRTELDVCSILSGVFSDVTTGTPISILIPNRNQNSQEYAHVRDILRPGHANYTYTKKFGVFDHRGGGRASGRETAARVAAGSVAQALLAKYSIEVGAFLSGCGDVSMQETWHIKGFPTKDEIERSPIFCPDQHVEERIVNALKAVVTEGDSIGGCVSFYVKGLPVGIGEPIFDKMEALLAQAMLSIPGTKGFDIGSGVCAMHMKGSDHNDTFILGQEGNIRCATNHSGGTLGGISSGELVYGKVYFKPPSSIKKTQQSLTFWGEKKSFDYQKGRHDPCIAIRGVFVVEAMLSLVVADLLLRAQSNQIQNVAFPLNKDHLETGV